MSDSTYYLATCQQGLQFFPDRLAALAEMRRALRPVGRLGIAVWCDVEDCLPFAALSTALEQVLGTETARVVEMGPWGFGDADSLAGVVKDSGFTNVNVRRRESPLIFEVALPDCCSRFAPRQWPRLCSASRIRTLGARLGGRRSHSADHL